MKVRELLKLVLSNATKKKQDSLSSLYNKLSTQLRALSSLGVTTDQRGVILYPLVESSLPTHILRSFERQRKNIDSEQSISTLDAIVSILKSEVQSEEKIKLSRSEILPYERECKHLADSQNKHPSAAELFIQEPNDTCAFCFKVHANRFCKRAFFIPLEEKIAIIKKNGLRRVCLAKGHLASRCRSQIMCQLCSKRHLKFMCPNIVCNKSDSPKQEDIPLNNVFDLDQIEKTNIVLRWRYIQKVRENLKQRFKREYLGFLRSSVTKREDKINVGDVVLIGTDDQKKGALAARKSTGAFSRKRWNHQTC
ncbi:transposon Tf2-6 polyprotein [Nephila pilipes]|uniref:Transposon Tf2-6 polyprotein n=1 Tax=Nephila pilipes TaxID=299642 RepID=A0A8X6MYJ1_NEPPI|nr:transposon Tf2-6 polyprotein [Nephila pilipes]